MLRLWLLLLWATAPLDASITLLDFENSYIKYNNLGGLVRTPACQSRRGSQRPARAPEADRAWALWRLEATRTMHSQTARGGVLP